jgi:hypothetical protein
MDKYIYIYIYLYYIIYTYYILYKWNPYVYAIESSSRPTIPGGADPKDPSQMLNDPEMMKARPRMNHGTSQETGDVTLWLCQNSY